MTNEISLTTDVVRENKRIGAASPANLRIFKNREFLRYLRKRYKIKLPGERGMWEIAESWGFVFNDELDVLLAIKKACDIDEEDKKWLTKEQQEDLATINYGEVRE